MKEYGGFIEYEYYHGKEYHEKAIPLNSGRHCVEYIIRVKGIKKIHIPYFLCDSISNKCKELNVDVERYHIGLDFLPFAKIALGENEWLYVVNYYGLISDEVLLEIKSKYERIIVDNTQAFFRKPIQGVDTFYSCRKFFGVPDGAYLYTDAVLEDEIPCDYSYNKLEFLCGRLEKNANEFYCQYLKSEKQFAKEKMKRMSKFTQNLLRSIDYERVKNVRAENYAYLDNKLRDINKLKPSLVEGAFMYPLYIENGVKIREKLKQKQIYIPTLWPDVFENCRENDLEYDMARNILPVFVDQRYTVKDMKYVVERIKESRGRNER